MLSSLLEICGLRGVVIHLFFLFADPNRCLSARQWSNSAEFSLCQPFWKNFPQKFSDSNNRSISRNRTPVLLYWAPVGSSAPRICDFCSVPAGHGWPRPYFRSVLAYGIFSLLLATGEPDHMFPKPV